MSKKQYKFYINVPVWTLNIDSYAVIASDEREAMSKFAAGEGDPLDLSEAVDEYKEKPFIDGKEELKESEVESKDYYDRSLVDVMEDEDV